MTVRSLIGGIIVLLSAVSTCAFGQNAPFGLEWGVSLGSLPPTSRVTRDRNITVAVYAAGDLPADFRDIAEITLKICKKEGLQQAISASRLLSGNEARSKFASAYAGAVRRYGRADEGDPEKGTASWLGSRVTMFAKLSEPGAYRIYVVQDGPGFASCGRTYDAAGSPGTKNR